MKHPNHFGRWLACVLLCLLLAGCSMPGEQVQVEELLRAPKLSGDYGDVQTALNDWLGESAQLKYPMQGDLLSPFLLQDLDGDGRQDAAVLYTTAQSSNVCIAILQKDDADIWHVRQNVEGLADTVESVGLAQLQPGDATQLVVGYTAAQGDHYLAVYSYTDGVLSTILEQQYQQYLVEDITGGGNQDLILMSTLEDGGVQIELLTVDKEGSFQQVAVMGLSANRFAGCASVAAGVGADGRHYLVLDGWTGVSGSGCGCGSCADWDTEEGAGALELPEGGAPEAETCPPAVQAQRHITAVLSANRALHKRFVMPVNLAIGKTRRKEANKKKRRHLYRRSSLIFCFVPYPVFTIAFQRNYPYTIYTKPKLL